jgi:signal transduction histidine kinase/purine-cytosine permease-like protein
MNRPAFIYREKRRYNAWAASETLEDYALRYTADHARIWSPARVTTTAVGSIAFLASEAIGASITLAFGFANSVAAIAAAVAIMFVIGLPIAWNAARHGLDIDLLTRGAGFGYMGSTVTSLIYASFTFLLFALEASILAVALKALTGIPMWIAYVLSAVVVIPIVIYGMRAISKVQAITQPVWLFLQLAPILYILWAGGPLLTEWQAFTGLDGAKDGGVGLLHFGLALSTLLSLLPQIGEQADYLRFLPAQEKIGRGRWWASVLVGGPGWAVIAGAKLLLGSLLAVFALQTGLSAAEASSPTDMFLAIFSQMTGHPGLALLLAATLVIVAQTKINITNAYAGSIAWSNFFARVTHSHPGRVVWLVFNVMLALLLMQIGILDLLDSILVLYAIVAAGWIGALFGDLAISKPLGLSPRGIEFKRAHLYDLNPVGVGAMGLAILVSALALAGIAGETVQAFAPLLGLTAAVIAAPALALATHGRYYIARTSLQQPVPEAHVCILCENSFQRADMAHCPFYAAPICSLCCTLEARCQDSCKTDARASDQIRHWGGLLLPDKWTRFLDAPVVRFAGLLMLMLAALAGLMQFLGALHGTGSSADVDTILTSVFLLFAVLAGIVSWVIVLGHQSRRAAREETRHNVDKLIEEIAAHDATDAQLQKARQAAEAANLAKSRYLVSVSHEVRSPLNAIYGYAQLLERGSDIEPRDAARVIRTSCEHLTNLVEGLHDISQVESGVLRLSRDTVPFPAFLDQIVSMFRPQAAAKGLSFVFERPDRLPDHVHADEKRLRQVLINLLSNAVKFTDAGEVGLRVRYRSDLATFEVSDTGIGIAEADQSRIFEPFERGSTAAAYRRQGVGLGLSITNALVQIMGGEISVTSAPARGTRFTVRLMLSRAMAGATEIRTSSAIRGYNGARRSILLIDDDPQPARGAAQPARAAGLRGRDRERRRVWPCACNRLQARYRAPRYPDARAERVGRRPCIAQPARRRATDRDGFGERT